MEKIKHNYILSKFSVFVWTLLKFPKHEYFPRNHCTFSSSCLLIYLKRNE